MLHSTLILLSLFLILWLWSLKIKDASIVDQFWGVGFIVVSFGDQYFNQQPLTFKSTLIMSLVLVWALRLSLYIHIRNKSKGEDRRYTKMRNDWDAAFWWKSGLLIFLFQALLIRIISLPLFCIWQSEPSSSLLLLDFIGLGLWLFGFFFEAVGDFQLSQFKAKPQNIGKVMNQGLWAYTRHPNYFGEALMWWGFFLLACGVPNGVWTFFSPLLMNFLLLKVSGVALLEKDLLNRKPEYRDYVNQTPPFWPNFFKKKTGSKNSRV